MKPQQFTWLELSIEMDWKCATYRLIKLTIIDNHQRLLTNIDNQTIIDNHQRLSTIIEDHRQLSHSLSIPDVKRYLDQKRNFLTFHLLDCAMQHQEGSLFITVMEHCAFP